MKSKWKRNGKNEIGKIHWKIFYSYAYYLLRGKKKCFLLQKAEVLSLFTFTWAEQGPMETRPKFTWMSFECLV